MKQHIYIVCKSTVPVGTNRKIKDSIQIELDKRNSELTFDIISNPEFLKEGTAVADCSRPDRIIVGTENEQVARVMKHLYLPYVKNNESFIFMDLESAEMTKYAANAMLATKISFMNEISNICERVGADVNMVRKGIGSDRRIGYDFIYAGCGYGGSCFPKDVRALISSSEKFNYVPVLLNAVENVNAAQKKIIPQKIETCFGEDLNGFTFAVWGLAFKPDTDDMRESAAIAIINELTKKGADIKAYDPKAMDEARYIYFKNNTNINYMEEKYSCLVDADALILITEWKEFRMPDFNKIKFLLKNPVIFDGRNQYDHEYLQECGIRYYQIGVGIK